MPRYITCHFCENKAEYKDDIYNPTVVYTCGESECLNQAMSRLWDDASVELDDDDHYFEGEEHDEEQ